MESEFAKNRVELFSDAVFAIIITLLILELKVPHVEHGESVPALGDALWLLAPKFLSWVISFIIVGIMWINHHKLFETLKKVNGQAVVLNSLILLWLSFIPFPTALMGDYPGNPLAVSFFGIALGLSAICFTFFRMYIANHSELLKEGVTVLSMKRSVGKSFLFGPAAYWIGAALAWYSIYLSFLLYIFIPLYFLLPFIGKAGSKRK